MVDFFDLNVRGELYRELGNMLDGCGVYRTIDLGFNT